MSDEDYWTEDERQERQWRRRAHDMSSSSDEEEDYVGVTERSPVTDCSDGDEKDKADSTEELVAKVGIECKALVHDNTPMQDVAGPQLSKETVKEAMKGAKRVDEINPNMILNKTILNHYHNVRIDESRILTDTFSSGATRRRSLDDQGQEEDEREILHLLESSTTRWRPLP